MHVYRLKRPVGTERLHLKYLNQLPQVDFHECLTSLNKLGREFTLFFSVSKRNSLSLSVVRLPAIATVLELVHVNEWLSLGHIHSRRATLVFVPMLRKRNANWNFAGKIKRETLSNSKIHPTVQGLTNERNILCKGNISMRIERKFVEAIYSCGKYSLSCSGIAIGLLGFIDIHKIRIMHSKLQFPSSHTKLSTISNRWSTFSNVTPTTVTSFSECKTLLWM